MVYVDIETVINPADLLSDKATAITLNWWFATLKSRAEKAAAKELASKGESFFLPVIIIEKITNGRKVICNLPLYPGYIFVAGDEDTLHHVFPSRHIVCMNQVRDKKTLLEQLCLTWQFIKSRRVIKLESTSNAGPIVKISSGPLCGVCGRLIDQGTTVRRLAVAGVVMGGEISIELYSDEELVEA